MSEHIDWERLARYVSGESSAPEAAEVEAWARRDERNQQLLISAERSWRAATNSEAFDVERAWSRVSAGLNGARRSHDLTMVPRTRFAPATLRWALPLAATIVLAVGIGIRWRVPRLGVPTIASRGGPVDVSTGIGERRTVKLPDGSEAILGARSKLRMDEITESGPRVVHLEGEAIFTVKHDTSHRFRVVAGDVVTEDIGTEFSVRAYPGEGRVRVAVREGAVSVARSSAPTSAAVLLGELDVAQVDASGDPAVISDVAVDRLFAWRDGELVFDDVPLSEVAAELSRWYDVEVRFADATLASRHLTASFKSEPIGEVLRVIGLSLEIRFEQRGRIVMAHAAPRTSSGEGLRPRLADVAARGGV